MRLLVTTAWYPNHVHPADGNFIQKLVELVADVHEVTVLCVVSDPDYRAAAPQLEERQEESGQVVRVTYSAAGNRLSRVWQRRKAWRLGLKHVSRQYDLVHGYIVVDGGIAAWRAARTMGVPFLLLEQSTRWHRPWSLLRRPELWLARAAARRARFVLTITTALRESMRRAGVEANYGVLSNVVHAEDFYPPATVDVSPLQTFQWLHVSDDSPKKRVDLLLETFYKLSKTHDFIGLIIAGLPNPDEVRERARSVYNRLYPATPKATDGGDLPWLQLIGERESSDIGQLMREADAFVLTSNLETQSVVVLEAQFSGLPTVTTSCGGPETIIATTGGGIIVDVEDNIGLLEAVIDVTDAGRASAEQRAALAKITRDHYSAAAIKAKLLAYYQQAVDA